LIPTRAEKQDTNAKAVLVGFFKDQIRKYKRVFYGRENDEII
jgi:hypothetical protein